jgi:LysM repeat protein
MGSFVDSAQLHHRPRKIRRTGRHTTPSQVEKVAATATKAAPAVAIAGALVATAAPQAHAAEKTPAKATVAVEQVHTVAAITHSQSSARSYTVRSGDTLSLIATKFYGSAGAWTTIYNANKSRIANPNTIFVGQVLTIPASASSSATSYTPKHAKAASSAKSSTTLTSSVSKLSGTLSCSGLEALWKAAGGSSSEAFMAAEIAMAESGGNQYAHSPTNDYGYWQINGVHGAMATYNAIGNAKAAISISDNGRDWGAWTTYTSGAYRGKC